MTKIKLGKFITNEFSLPLVIAEIGVNHNCDLSLAKKIFEAPVDKRTGFFFVAIFFIRSILVISEDEIL